MIPIVSKREIQIVELMCGNYNSQQIADQLCISKRTVDFHRGNLMRKFDAKNTATLVMRMLAGGYISVGERSHEFSYN